MIRRGGQIRLLGLAAALVALLTAVGGLVISQAAGGGSEFLATIYDDAVRFTVQNEKMEILRAEVFDLAGKRLFDSGPGGAAVSSQRAVVRF